MKLEKDLEKTGFYQYYPVVPTVVVAKSGDKMDALAVAWNMALSFDPPLFGVAISPKRYSYRLLRVSKEFTANFLPFESLAIIAAVGRTSGREIDKFSTYKIKTSPSSIIATPFLRDAYAAYECKVIRQIKTGDHVLFVGEVQAVHYTAGFFNKKTKIPELRKFTPALYLGADHYIGIRSFAETRIGKEEVLPKK